LLAYQKKNLILLKKFFRVKQRQNPLDVSKELRKKIEVLFAPLGFFVGKREMDLSPKLKVIISNTTGVPHIDIEEARKRGIFLSALHDQQRFLQSITPTAEHTFGLILGLLRKIPWAYQDVCQGRWNRRSWGACTMLSRMRLGIVGLGRLGKLVKNRAQAFGMKVLFYDPYVPGGCATLKDLVSQVDILSLHVPSNNETKNLISKKIIKLLPRGAYVINTARGEILDHSALLKDLKCGRLGGAALDVMDGEYKINFQNKLASHPLVQYARKNKNLIITPHIGGSTIDAWEETEKKVIVRAAAHLGLKP